MPIITPLYAALAAVILSVVSLRVIMVRRSRRVAIGDGADDDTARRIRPLLRCDSIRHRRNLY